MAWHVGVLAIAFLSTQMAQGGDREVGVVFLAPSDVFGAYQKAVAEKDWKTAFGCLTGKARDNITLNAYYECLAKNNRAAVADLMKKHSLEQQAVESVYAKRYLAKNGVDLIKLRQERENRRMRELEEDNRKRGLEPPAKPQPQPLISSPVLSEERTADPALDTEILVAAIRDLVKDEQAFCASAYTLLGWEDPKIGRIVTATTQENSATIVFTQVIDFGADASTEPRRKNEREINRTMNLAKTGRGWLITEER